VEEKNIKYKFQRNNNNNFQKKFVKLKYM
jgi:hypothetical protein